MNAESSPSGRRIIIIINNHTKAFKRGPGTRLNKLWTRPTERFCLLHCRDVHFKSLSKEFVFNTAHPSPQLEITIINVTICNSVLAKQQDPSYSSTSKSVYTLMTYYSFFRICCYLSDVLRNSKKQALDSFSIASYLINWTKSTLLTINSKYSPTSWKHSILGDQYIVQASTQFQPIQNRELANSHRDYCQQGNLLYVCCGLILTHFTQIFSWDLPLQQ